MAMPMLVVCIGSSAYTQADAGIEPRRLSMKAMLAPKERVLDSVDEGVPRAHAQAPFGHCEEAPAAGDESSVRRPPCATPPGRGRRCQEVPGAADRSAALQTAAVPAACCYLQLFPAICRCKPPFATSCCRLLLCPCCFLLFSGCPFSSWLLSRSKHAFKTLRFPFPR